MKIKTKVHLLPSNNKTSIGLTEHNELANLNESHLINPYCKPQLLYITSDDEIEEGFKGWVIVTFKGDTTIKHLVNIIVSEQTQCYCNEDRKFSYQYYSVKPIIATIDLDLYQVIKHSVTDRGFNEQKSFPRHSQSFIQKYMEEYNKGNVIEDIMVEYEFDNSNWDDEIGTKYGIDYKHKVSSDNTIIIHKLEDNFSREEHISGIKRMISLYITTYISGDIEKWIEENL